MQSVQRTVGERLLVLETGHLARQASGAVLVKYGDVVVLVACVGAESDPGPGGPDFFPLTVDYREKMSAAGKIPGGFFKREGRPTTKETVTCRLIDRPLRPLWPEGYRREVQIQASVLSAGPDLDPDVFAMIAASAALHVSNLPFERPVGAVRVGLLEGKFVVNPTAAQLATSEIDLVVAGTEEGIVMVECSGKEVPEETVVDAILFAHREILSICEMQEELRRLCGKPKVAAPTPPKLSSKDAQLRRSHRKALESALFTAGKQARLRSLREVEEKIQKDLLAEFQGTDRLEEETAALGLSVEKLERELERESILGRNQRTDGRDLVTIRPIEIQTGVLPRTHGSALFTRGETQAIVTTTLGTKLDEQKIEGLGEEVYKKFLLHYNFPSFSVGEMKPNRGPSRRDIGHGNLAERAIQAVIPMPDKFPYTIRIVSDILESNGSSSMATVCGATLALMDAGVPIRRPVAGVAMGLVKEGGDVRVLTDIQGSEDHNGDMDFKVAGTTRGITALQMDLKCTGITEAILRDALTQARDARREILVKMLKVLREPRPEISAYAPRLYQIRINPEKIGALIGPGGKQIKKIQEETGATVNVEDDGVVQVSALTEEAAKRALEMVQAVTEEVEVGRVYTGRAVSVKDFGVFVEVLPGQEGLLHVSEMGNGYVAKAADLVKVGDVFDVKVLSIDENGKIRLSTKALQNPSAETSAAPPGPRPPAPRRGPPRSSGARR